MARILVIDDNDEFREMLTEILKSEGYEVVAAADGKVGLDLYCEDPTDVIITDVNMPEKSGPELIFELKRKSPDAKIIAISGGTVNSEAYLRDIAAFSDIKHVFSKPINMDEMLRAVKELVNQ